MKNHHAYRTAIYLKGNSLSPENVTRLLGIQPTDCHVFGETWLTFTGKEVRAKTGLWTYEISSESDKSKHLEAALAELALMFGGHKLSTIEGAEEAYVDIFLATDADPDGGGSADFEIKAGVIAALAETGAPLRLTVSVVRE